MTTETTTVRVEVPFADAWAYAEHFAPMGMNIALFYNWGRWYAWYTDQRAYDGLPNLRYRPGGAHEECRPDCPCPDGPRMNIPICDLCGLASLDVRPGIVEYPDGFHSIHRCSDHSNCEERVFLAGDEWPLVRREETANASA